MNADPKHRARPLDGDTARTTVAPPSNVTNVLGSLDPGGHANGEATAALVAYDDPGTNEVLDVDGATRLLRIGRNTIYELVARNAIPHRRLGKQIRFSRAAIMRWLDSWSSQGAKERQ